MKERAPSLRVTLAINKMYSEMARAAAKEAVSEARAGRYGNANNAAEHAERYAKRAGGNALYYGLL